MRRLGVTWNPKGVFEWDCRFGCHGTDYPTGEAATRAYNVHPCVNDIERKK